MQYLRKVCQLVVVTIGVISASSIFAIRYRCWRHNNEQRDSGTGVVGNDVNDNDILDGGEANAAIAVGGVTELWNQEILQRFLGFARNETARY